MKQFQPTPEQLRVIDIDDGPVLVSAPPGAGKTLVLTERIVRLLRDSASQRFRVLALTFTTRAAEEMRSRIREHAGDEWRRVSAGTFHAFCLEALSNYGKEVGFRPDNSIYDREPDRIDALTVALDDLGVAADELEPGALSSLLAAFSRLKRDLLQPGDVAADDVVGGVTVSEAYDAYSQQLRRNHAYDFDDLLLLCHRLFVEMPWAAKHYRRVYRYILVDEAQDTSRAQYEILSALCGDEHRNVMLVGDPNQYIYRFAGASSEYMDRFVEDFSAKRYELTVNFRSARAIVESANELATHVRDAGTAMRARKTGGRAEGVLTVTSYADERTEARAVVDAVERLLDDGLPASAVHSVEDTSCAPEDICILARARYLLTHVLAELDEREIAYVHNVARRETFESRSFCLIYHGLRLIQNPADAAGRANVLRDCLGADDTTARAGADVSVPLSEFLESIGAGDAGLAGIAGLLANASGSRGQIDLLVRDLLKEVDDPDVGEDESPRFESDRQLFTNRWNSYRQRSSRDGRTLAAFLGELALGGRSALDEPGVRVLTVHAAKGLEFRAVLLVGLNEGNFPDFRAKTPGAMSEERRSMYVALTRAERYLAISRHRKRTNRWNRVFDQRPSRFLAEAGLTEVAT